MKKIIYNILYLLPLALCIQSCSEELDYRNMNITQLGPENEVTDFVGDLTSQIVIKNAAGEVVDNVDMGATFYVIDNSMDGVTSRAWTIGQETSSTSISSTDKMVRLNFPKPGPVTFSVTSTRDTDGASTTANQTVEVNVIPVTVDFVSSLSPDGGPIKIFLGESVPFTAVAKGSPSAFEWTAEGPETYTETGSDATIQFSKVGTYSISLKGLREDAPGEFIEDVETKTALIEVMPVDMEMIRAACTNDILTLNFGFPVQTDLADLASAFTVSIETSSQGTIDATVTAVSVSDSDPNTIELKLNNKMFSDDKMYLSVAADALSDVYKLTPIPAIERHLVSYGLGWLVAGDFDNPDDWEIGSQSASATDPTIVSDPVTPGSKGAASIFKDEGSASYICKHPFELPAGAKFKIEFDARSHDVNRSKAGIEFRFDTDPGGTGRLGDGIGGNWTGANNFPQGSWKHFTKDKTYTGSGLEECYVYILFYGEGHCYIDNLKIFVDNPRP